MAAGWSIKRARRDGGRRVRPTGLRPVGLVCVAAFAPAEGESLGEATAASKDAVLGTALVPLHYPALDE